VVYNTLLAQTQATLMGKYVEKYYSEDLGMNGRIILKWVLEKEFVIVWSA
jgi:predicted DNA-binding protein YlxM (UPF0122 family)